MKIIAITKQSPLYGRIPVGAKLIGVNGRSVADLIDFQFHNTEASLKLRLSYDGVTKEIKLSGTACGDLGLSFEESRIRICNNKCLFCFVHQQPKGMRRSLYLRDDDFRYSFTHGNFITLSNMTEADYERIVAQRLSPLYISVHATDDKLRRCIFQNEKLEAIIPRLKHLVEHGITLHTQTVVAPGLNDGAYLEKTVRDLAALAPGVASLAIVPVGLTKFREKLPALRPFRSDEARKVIAEVAKWQKEFLAEKSIRFAYAADEFFIVAGRPLPSLAYYDEMPQFENGVGMARKFVTDFNRRKRFLPSRLKKGLHVQIVTGKSAAGFMQDAVISHLRRIGNLTISLAVVENRFWGEMVTVTGLLTGGDILDVVKSSRADILLLPPNCLNFDQKFLDDMSLTDFTSALGRPVLTGTYDIASLVRQAFRQEVVS